MMNAKSRIAAEAAAGAELLIDAKAAVGRICDAAVLRSFARGGARNSIRLAAPILRSTTASWISGERDMVRTNSDRIIIDPARNCTVGRHNLN